MQVDTIHYARKMSDGRYGNVELGMHAQLDPSDDPARVAQLLRTTVLDLLAQDDKLEGQIEDTQAHLYTLTQELAAKERDLERLGQRWSKARDFLERNGVDTGRNGDDPF